MKISEQSHLSIYKIETGAGKQTPAGKSPENLPFAPGQLIKGTVAGFTTDGKVLLDVGGQTITARTMVPLKLGSELWLETGSGSSPLLTLAAKKGAVQDFLKLLLAGSPMASANTREVADLLSALMSESAPQTTPGGQVITAGAIAATSDGKSFPEAIRMLTLLLGGSPGAQKEIELLLDSVAQKAAALKPGLEPDAEKLVKILAAHQQINSHPPQPNDQNFLLFPCFFAGNAGWGEWIFSMEKQSEQEREEHYSLSFFLEMSRLGPVALQVSVAGRTITGQFQLASEKARDHVAAHVPELARILDKQGYQPASFVCRVDRDNMVSQLKEALQEKAAIRRFSLLDVSV